MTSNAAQLLTRNCVYVLHRAAALAASPPAPALPLDRARLSRLPLAAHPAATCTEMGCGPSTTIVLTPTADTTDERGPASTKHNTQQQQDGGRGGGSPDPIVSLSLHPQRFYTLKSIAKAANAPDAPVLTIISGLVYDVTQFLPMHPGGEDLLRTYGAGQDCTLWFTKPPSDERPFAHVHGKTSLKMLERMRVGWIVSDTDPRAGRSLEDVEADESAPTDHRSGKAVEQHRSAAAEDSELASGQRGHAYVHSRDETSAASNNAYQSSTLRMQALHRIKQVERQQTSKHQHNGSAQSAVSLPGMVSSAPQVSVLQAYSQSEIASHATQHDCWTIAQRHQVFDVTSLVTTVPPLFDWRRAGGKDSSAYLASKFSEEQVSAFLAPLHIGFVEGHSLQTADLARVPSGTRGGSMAGPNGGAGGPRRSSNSLMSTADTGLDSAAARAALDAITNDDLTIAASEGLLPAPNNTRYLWRLVASRDLTHDTKLLTFDPVTAAKDLAFFRAHLSEDDRELAERFPVVYSPTPLRPAIAHHISVEIPFVLPVENQAERSQRERENRPLDVPFRMQRSYTPLDAGPLVPRSSQLQLLVKSYPKIAGAHGSEYMHSLRAGDVMVSTGARSRFDFEALAAPRSDDSPKYDYWVCLVAGSGIAAVYAIIRELLRRCSAAQMREQAAVAAGQPPPDQHVRGRSHSSRAASSDSTMHRGRSDSYACAPCKRIVLIYCSRSEEDIILGPELDALVEAHPSLFSVFHVLSRPLFSPKASSFSGRLSAELLRIVLPPALQPRDTAQEALMVGGLLGAGAIPGSRPRSPVNAQARPNVHDLHARVVAAQEVVRGSSAASSLHGSPLLNSNSQTGAAVVPNIAAIMAAGNGGSGTNSRPGSRPRSPARFHFNIPTRSTPPTEPAAVAATAPAAAPAPATAPATVIVAPQPQPAVAAAAIGSGRSTLLSVGVKSTPPFAPSSAPGSPMPVIGENLLHVPDGLKNVTSSSDGAGDSLASSHRGSHVPGGPSALFQRLGLGGGGGGGAGASGTGSGSGSARGVRTTALALVCGPIEFNGAALGLLAKFGFKRGLGNMNGKDVHLF